MGAIETSRKRFDELARQWREGRGATSSIARMCAHPAYREIIAMGKPAIPWLLSELDEKPDHWFVALTEITGADPIAAASRGRIKEMAAAWLEWGRKNG